LNDDVKALLEQGKIEMGHARALLVCEGTLQSELGQVVASKTLTVRETEKLVKKHTTVKQEISDKPVNDKLFAMEDELTKKLGTKVSLSQTKNGKGKLVINFDQDDKLQEILSIFQS